MVLPNSYVCLHSDQKMLRDLWWDEDTQDKTQRVLVLRQVKFTTESEAVVKIMRFVSSEYEVIANQLIEFAKL